MSGPRNARTVRIIEDVVVLAAAVLLVFWVFSSRSSAWGVALAVAVLVLAAIFIRRLAGWIRARGHPPAESP